jgi:hypothetical protein
MAKKIVEGIAGNIDKLTEILSNQDLFEQNETLANALELQEDDYAEFVSLQDEFFSSMTEDENDYLFSIFVGK